MSFEQVKPKKGYELVMEQLKERIQKGEFAPGSRLDSVVVLAAGLGVGRSTVREALSALQAMGWVTIRQGGGTFVARELPADSTENSGGEVFFAHARSLRELLQIRQILETGAASLAAEHRTENDLAALREVLADMKANLGREEESEKADVRFHLLIARATGNGIALDMMNSLSHRLHDSMRESRKLWFYAERAEAERLLEEHAAIYGAVEAGDKEQAFNRMRDHLFKVESQLRLYLTP